MDFDSGGSRNKSPLSRLSLRPSVRLSVSPSPLKINDGVVDATDKKTEEKTEETFFFFVKVDGPGGDVT